MLCRAKSQRVRGGQEPRWRADLAVFDGEEEVRASRIGGSLRRVLTSLLGRREVAEFMHFGAFGVGQGMRGMVWGNGERAREGETCCGWLHNKTCCNCHKHAKVM